MTAAAICKRLRKQLGLGYKKVSSIPVQANSERCLVLRQQYALKMIELLSTGKEILNIDESWINQTEFHRRM